MSEQNTDIQRTRLQNTILDLEKKYMDILERIIRSDVFTNDLKNIEQEIQEYYEILQEVWGKKNKIKEASERLLRHHMYTNFPSATTFYPSPISCDIALELDDIILNIDVKTIDKIGNSGDLKTTQFEHNQTSFVNKPVLASGNFPGFKVQSNLKNIDPRTHKPILTFLVKIGYSDNNEGDFHLLNSSRYPSLILTCLPNGALSNLFNNDLFANYKDYKYYEQHNGIEYKPRHITTREEYNCLDLNGKFIKIESKTLIPDSWQRINWGNKAGYYDTVNSQVWWTQELKKNNHKEIFLKAVQDGNTARFNNEWLEKRYDSRNTHWKGERKYYNVYS